MLILHPYCMELILSGLLPFTKFRTFRGSRLANRQLTGKANGHWPRPEEGAASIIFHSFLSDRQHVKRIQPIFIDIYS